MGSHKPWIMLNTMMIRNLKIIIVGKNFIVIYHLCLSCATVATHQGVSLGEPIWQKNHHPSICHSILFLEQHPSILPPPPPYGLDMSLKIKKKKFYINSVLTTFRLKNFVRKLYFMLLKHQKWWIFVLGISHPVSSPTKTGLNKNLQKKKTGTLEKEF